MAAPAAPVPIRRHEAAPAHTAVSMRFRHCTQGRECLAPGSRLAFTLAHLGGLAEAPFSLPSFRSLRLSVATIESGETGEAFGHVKHGGSAMNLVSSLATVGSRVRLGSTE
jgi:hypothetical protein